MRHQKKKQQLNCQPSHRNALLRNLATSIILYEKVKTTQTRAKRVQPLIEKLILLTKKESELNAIRQINQIVFDKNASRKLMQKLKKRYQDRNSGFTRITNLKVRDGDAATLSQIELV